MSDYKNFAGRVMDIARNDWLGREDNLQKQVNTVLEEIRADERERFIQAVNSLKWSESYDSGFVNNAAADYNAALADVIEAIKAE